MLRPCACEACRVSKSINVLSVLIITARIFGKPGIFRLVISHFRSLDFHIYVHRAPPANIGIMEELPSQWKSTLPSSRFLSPVHVFAVSRLNFDTDVGIGWSESC
ncbi:hypothetical protein K443DRAFT_293880 [Laccaria amethystina LaAM-08-1]|uniref:Uncharacterized protein n=1 Tax=Laccaria amethystina LaAM-08-1 TaxID=1095629 RepID=A0A0C9WKC1_9AGAR|nr:hypothetical protein K443DRAFT_293880 [Laccaria amethystina LaAM-08-1]